MGSCTTAQSIAPSLEFLARAGDASHLGVREQLISMALAYVKLADLAERAQSLRVFRIFESAFYFTGGNPWQRQSRSRAGAPGADAPPQLARFQRPRSASRRRSPVIAAVPRRPGGLRPRAGRGGGCAGCIQADVRCVQRAGATFDGRVAGTPVRVVQSWRGRRMSF